MEKSNNKPRYWLIPDELWEKIEPLLPKHINHHRFGGGRPRAADRDAMNGIFFVLRTGCQWNALNVTGICSSSTAHRRFQEWTAAGVFEKLWKQGLLEYEQAKGLNWQWQSMDGAMGKAPLGGKKTGPNPTDRAKEGVKRSILCEGSGIPLAVALDGANRHDMKLAKATLESIEVKRPRATKQQKQNLCLDKGYDFDEVRELAREFKYTLHIRARGEEAQKLKRKAGYRARRWVVERTFSWMNRFRRILIRWEKKAENYLALLHFVCAIITYRGIGLLG
jgi:putative transposase